MLRYVQPASPGSPRPELTPLAFHSQPVFGFHAGQEGDLLQGDCVPEYLDNTADACLEAWMATELRDAGNTTTVNSTIDPDSMSLSSTSPEQEVAIRVDDGELDEEVEGLCPPDT